VSHIIRQKSYRSEKKSVRTKLRQRVNWPSAKAPHRETLACGGNLHEFLMLPPGRTDRLTLLPFRYRVKILRQALFSRVVPRSGSDVMRKRTLALGRAHQPQSSRVFIRR